MIKIVVVEDEMLVKKGLILTTDWQKFDCEVVGEASNGIEGIEVIQGKRPDIVITDVRMPGMDGLGATRRIREREERQVLAFDVPDPKTGEVTRGVPSVAISGGQPMTRRAAAARAKLERRSQAQLARNIDLSPAAISQFESGAARPSSETVSALSAALDVPRDFFTQPVADTHEGFFRSLRRTGVVDRRRARAVAHLAHDLALHAAAREHDLPVLGICRGMQVLNVAFGGTLAQDCTSPDGPHRPVAKDPAQVRSAEHPVELSPDSRLVAIYGRTRRQVAPAAQATADVTLAEVATGTERLVNVNGRRLTVKIPPGVSDGHRVRIAAKGNAGLRGGHPARHRALRGRRQPRPPRAPAQPGGLRQGRGGHPLLFA